VVSFKEGFLSIFCKFKGKGGPVLNEVPLHKAVCID